MKCLQDHPFKMNTFDIDSGNLGRQQRVSPFVSPTNQAPEGSQLKPADCPKYLSCNASICPLDPDWHKRKMTCADGTCAWFREQAKAGPEAIAVPEELRGTVAQVLRLAQATAGLSPLRRGLKRAAMCGSRSDPRALQNLKRAAGSNPQA